MTTGIKAIRRRTEDIKTKVDSGNLADLFEHSPENSEELSVDLEQEELDVGF